MTVYIPFRLTPMTRSNSLLGEVGDAGAAGDAGGADDDVEPAVSGGGLGHHPLAVGEARDVAGDGVQRPEPAELGGGRREQRPR